MVRSSTYTDIIHIIRRYSAALTESAGGSIVVSYFIRNKKGYFRFPAIKHVSTSQKLPPRLAIFALAETRELPPESFETGIRKTVQWYLNDMDWVKSITSGEYQKWLDNNYSNRRTA